MWIARQPGSRHPCHVAAAFGLAVLLACFTVHAQDRCDSEEFRRAHPERCTHPPLHAVDQYAGPLAAQAPPASTEPPRSPEPAEAPEQQPHFERVPNVVGFPEALAALRLGLKHLDPRNVGSEQSNQPRGTVLRTEPVADTQVLRNSDVVYWTASGSNIVPDLRGLSTDQARASLQSKGFRLGTVGERASDGQPGVVLTQAPTAGSTAEVDSQVAVAVSSDEVVVPDVAGLPEQEARQRIQQTPLQPTPAGERPSPQPRGTVLDARPAAGAKARRNDSVTYVIASGQNTVPDLRGRSVADAPALLSPAGFQSGASSERADLGPAGRVLEQSPAAGSLAALGTAVAMTVSRELRVPDVVRESSETARAQLEALGLVPQVTGSEPSPRPKGEVLRSDPIAGSRVLDGARVAYAVASGKNVVPNLRDHSIDTVGRELADAGFKVGETQVKPDAGASGRILEQVPLAGEAADLDSAVALTVSGDYPSVPYVVGKPEAEAMQRLQQTGFVPRRGNPRPSPLAAGIVLETAPAAGTMAKPGDPVDYWPASGENLVPDTRKRPPSEARQQLQEAGFAVGAIDQVYAAGVGEQVQAQSPQAGKLAPLGSEVSLTIASGVPIVPDVVGKPLDEATALLQKAGLVVGDTTREFHVGKKDIVLWQQFVRGTPLKPGDGVALRVSRSFVAAGIAGGVLLLGLGGAWWKLLRPWPLKPPLHVDARLEPFDAVDEASVDAVRSAGRDANVALSAHLEYGPIAATSVPIVEEEKAHG